MLKAYFEARKLKKDALTLKAQAELKYNRAVQDLADFLTENGREATAKYKNVGVATMKSPKVYISFTKDKEDMVFEWVKEIGNGDIIKETIHNGTLTSICKERLSQGEELPEFINVFYKPQISGREI